LFHSVLDTKADYVPAPFGPGEPFPELAGVIPLEGQGGRLYGLFRDLLHRAGYDAANFGTPEWNPLGAIVAGRRRIVIKPNLVLHRVGELACSIKGLVVHASVIRVVVDYLLLAARRLDQSVEIVIADTPLQSADFDLLCEQNGLADLMRHYREQGAPVSLLDLRSERAVINDSFLILERRRLPGDPAGSLVIDLGTRSLHYEKTGDNARYSIQDYDDGVTQQNHSGRVHRYCFSRTILDADLVINLSKLKTHGKAGVTLAMKNIIGANVSKDYLPHFLTGGPRQGGDEFSSNSGRQVVVRRVREFFYRHPALAPAHRILKSAAYSFEQQKSRGGDVNAYAGAWHGNDTVWRTIVDINRALTFADAAGALADSPQREVLYLVDGIWGMEGEGPLKGEDRHVGLLAIGDDPVEFDAKLACFMGFEPQAVPYIGYWREPRDLSIGRYPASLAAGLPPGPAADFREPAGWRGKLRATLAA
jgi:uncharacterized protein (DUF362 family)